MEKLGMKKIFTKKLYIEDDIITDLSYVGIQGMMIQNMLDFYDVKEAIRMLNIISMKEDMFPSLAFSALSYFQLADVNCVIIGGMPDMSNIETWTGSGYSYDLQDHKTILHKKIIEDIYGIGRYDKEVESDNDRLQRSGVLLLHDTMSVTKNHASTCRDLWVPIIFRILNNISVTDNNVPIIFTTNTSRSIYKNAVLASNTVECLNFTGNIMPVNSPNVFEYVESVANRGKLKTDKIDFLDKITKWK